MWGQTNHGQISSLTNRNHTADHQCLKHSCDLHGRNDRLCCCRCGGVFPLCIKHCCNDCYDHRRKGDLTMKQLLSLCLTIVLLVCMCTASGEDAFALTLEERYTWSPLRNRPKIRQRRINGQSDREPVSNGQSGQDKSHRGRAEAFSDDPLTSINKTLQKRLPGSRCRGGALLTAFLLPDDESSFSAGCPAAAGGAGAARSRLPGHRPEGAAFLFAPAQLHRPRQAGVALPR